MSLRARSTSERLGSAGLKIAGERASMPTCSLVNCRSRRPAVTCREEGHMVDGSSASSGEDEALPGSSGMVLTAAIVDDVEGGGV